MKKLFCISLAFLLISYLLVSQNVNSKSKRHSFKSKKSESVNKGQSNTQTQDYDLTKVLPDGFVKDGSVDYTTFIQKGIDENLNVIMPNFPVLINKKGISVKSNSSIIFKKKSALLMEPNDLSNYAVLLISNVSNVVIQSPVIIGERNKHKGIKGEWGMGVFITDSKNIQISSSSISNCWGDGIYIGGGEINANENIKITDAKINNCRRNGISITNGKDIFILNSTILNTNGTSPMAGIDIEPNNDKSTIDNILISNVTTLNNGYYGILIVLGALPVIISKSVTIKIDNHIDRQSKTAFYIAKFRGDYKDKTALLGSIIVNNPKWYNNKKTLVVDSFDLGPKTNFKNIKIFKDELGAKNTLSKQELIELKKEQSTNKNVVIE